MKTGLYANINAKKKRIAAGSGEKMRKVGSKGAPTAKAFIQSKKTAKKKWHLKDGIGTNGPTDYNKFSEFTKKL